MKQGQGFLLRHALPISRQSSLNLTPPTTDAARRYKRTQQSFHSHFTLNTAVSSMLSRRYCQYAPDANEVILLSFPHRPQRVNQNLGSSQL